MRHHNTTTAATSATTLTVERPLGLRWSGCAMLEHPDGVEHPDQRVDHAGGGVLEGRPVDLVSLRDTERLPEADGAIEEGEGEGFLLRPLTAAGYEVLGVAHEV